MLRTGLATTTTSSTKIPMTMARSVHMSLTYTQGSALERVNSSLSMVSEEGPPNLGSLVEAVEGSTESNEHGAAVLVGVGESWRDLYEHELLEVAVEKGLTSQPWMCNPCA